MDITDPALYAGPEWNPTVPYYVPSCLGDGRDGPKLYTVNTQLAADVRASLVVVYPGVTLLTMGFELISQDLILNLGIISADGAAAVGAVQGSAMSAANTAHVAGGSGGPRTNVGFGTVFDPAFPGSPFITYEALGAAGGAGAGAGAGAGGNNSSVSFDQNLRSPLNGPNPTDLVVTDWIGGAPSLLTVGAGGGGGNAATGGAGGAGGNLNRLRARRIINRNIISARGGAGGAATGANGSGGGGGGGGRNIACGLIFGNGLWLVNGGAGGTGNGTGTAGNPGSSGTNHFYP